MTEQELANLRLVGSAHLVPSNDPARPVWVPPPATHDNRKIHCPSPSSSPVRRP